jgi:p-hydroxybenzoate 3-monooxygenase
VLDLRTGEDIEQTVKAGVLEHGTLDLLTTTGLGHRMPRDEVLDDLGDWR